MESVLGYSDDGSEEDVSPAPPQHPSRDQRPGRGLRGARLAVEAEEFDSDGPKPRASTPRLGSTGGQQPACAARGPGGVWPSSSNAFGLTAKCRWLSVGGGGVRSGCTHVAWSNRLMNGTVRR